MWNIFYRIFIMKNFMNLINIATLQFISTWIFSCFSRPSESDKADGIHLIEPRSSGNRLDCAEFKNKFKLLSEKGQMSKFSINSWNSLTTPFALLLHRPIRSEAHDAQCAPNNVISAGFVRRSFPISSFRSLKSRSWFTNFEVFFFAPIPHSIRQRFAAKRRRR